MAKWRGASVQINLGAFWLDLETFSPVVSKPSGRLGTHDRHPAVMGEVAKGQSHRAGIAALTAALIKR